VASYPTGGLPNSVTVLDSGTLKSEGLTTSTANLSIDLASTQVQVFEQLNSSGNSYYTTDYVSTEYTVSVDVTRPLPSTVMSAALAEMQVTSYDTSMELMMTTVGQAAGETAIQEVLPVNDPRNVTVRIPEYPVVSNVTTGPNQSWF
jgi:hypothetical protein